MPFRSSDLTSNAIEAWSEIRISKQFLVLIIAISTVIFINEKNPLLQTAGLLQCLGDYVMSFCFHYL